MSEPKSPQDKKRLSYAKDRRNVYGERGANSRFAIRKSKDLIERSGRHEQNQLLRSVVGVVDEAQAVATENAILSSKAAKKRFYKMPDAPLGAVVESKLEYRKFKGMGAKKVRSKQERQRADAQHGVQGSKSPPSAGPRP